MTRKFFALFLATFALSVNVQATTPTTLGDSAVTLSNELSVDNTSSDKYEWDFWWSASCDLASNYMWRGFDQSYRGGNGNMVDPSFQPGITIGYGKFYINLWGNASLLSDYKEFDMFLGFEHENLSITIYDVFCGVGSDFNTRFFDKDMHNLTATIDYTFFDRLRLHWATTFIHSSDFLTTGKRAGKRAFSSYFEVAYTQPVKDLFDIEITAGASPWTGPFWCPTRVGNEYDWDNPAKGFNVTNLSLMFNKEFEAGNVTFPLQVGYIYNPLSNYHYAIVKAGFAF